jgi:hypothetical protein
MLCYKVTVGNNQAQREAKHTKSQNSSSDIKIDLESMLPLY